MAGASAGAGLSFTGCATTSGAFRAAAADCLPLVNVSENRVIRELVGLRPYRPGGFVVRRERFDTKTLVHNYGHGGAGITLSWGTSRMAVDLGLQGHNGPVAVIGAGIVGLTTARLVQEAGFKTTIYAAALPPETTSNIAGASWYPSSLFDRQMTLPGFQQQLETALRYAYRRFQYMAGSEYGIRWMKQYEIYRTPAPPGPKHWFTTLMESRFLPEVRELEPGQHPFGRTFVRKYSEMIIETDVLLEKLLRDFYAAGGKVVVRKFDAAAELSALPEGLVFNASGLGSRQLFGDSSLRPMRGQLAVLLPQPEVDYALSHDEGLYMFSRSDGVVLGGTTELDNWDLTPDPATTRRLLDRHRRIFSQMSCPRPT